MKKNDNYLVCKAVKFYSQKDEDAFFDWIKKIDCIDSLEAAGDELYLDIAAWDIHDYDLRDLIALFRRYKIDMKQLARFLTKDNKHWFAKKSAPWYKKIFGIEKKADIK